MKMKKYITLVFLLASAAEGATWKDSPYVTIERLYPHSEGMAFYPDYSDKNVSSCDNGTRFNLVASDENYEVKVSVLMAAYMAGKKVLLRYDSSQPKQCAAVVDRFIVK